MTAITEWVRNIALVVLFASFLELLLPNSSMQRFIRVILGLTIMLAILNPALDFLQHRLTPEQLPALSSGGIGNSGQVLDGAANAVRERDRLTAQLYKSDLARQIRAVVLAIDGVAEARVALELAPGQPGKQSSGAIEKITVFVTPGSAAQAGQVAKITVGPELAPGAELQPSLQAKIARTVAELYQLHGNQVEVRKMN